MRFSEIEKTNKGDQQIFKGRIKKLMPDKLNEYRIEKTSNGVEEFIVMIDPNYKQLKSLVDKSEYQFLRGIYYPADQSFYWWDGDKYIHFQMSRAMGMDEKNYYRLELHSKWVDGEERYVMDYLEDIGEFLTHTDYVNRNFDIIDEGYMVFALKNRGQK